MCPFRNILVAQNPYQSMTHSSFLGISHAHPQFSCSFRRRPFGRICVRYDKLQKLSLTPGFLYFPSPTANQHHPVHLSQPCALKMVKRRECVLVQTSRTSNCNNTSAPQCSGKNSETIKCMTSRSCILQPSLLLSGTAPTEASLQ